MLRCLEEKSRGPAATWKTSGSDLESEKNPGHHGTTRRNSWVLKKMGEEEELNSTDLFCWEGNIIAIRFDKGRLFLV